MISYCVGGNDLTMRHPIGHEPPFFLSLPPISPIQSQPLSPNTRMTAYLAQNRCTTRGAVNKYGPNRCTGVWTNDGCPIHSKIWRQTYDARTSTIAFQENIEFNFNGIEYDYLLRRWQRLNHATSNCTRTTIRPFHIANVAHPIWIIEPRYTNDPIVPTKSLHNTRCF